jgi:predicted nucleic acid-binding protein
VALIVVDSSVWIAQIRGQRTAQVERLKTADPLELIVGDIVLLEVLQGARDDTHAATLLRNLQRFRPVEMMSLEVAIEGGRNYRRLRALGLTTRKTTDLIIATYCLLSGYALLHQDRDFSPYARHLGLKLAIQP